ncbi:MAG TPA: two-component regulator propeller domain-containing protein, partial [Chitinophagaceae bacterium]|nr:two-component regulator propeller domain-containing protein [Chitinophagaceae bacterium]
MQKNTEGFNYIGNRFRILEDHAGIIWINMKRGGFGYYNEVKGSIDNALKTPDASNYQLPKLIYTIYYDSAGILWFTTYEKELVKVILQPNDFRQKLLTIHASSISENEVRGIFFDNKNRLWIGTKNGEVHVLQKDKKISGLFVNEPKEGMGLVYSILQDSRGNIWLGTKGNGLYKASPLNPNGTKYYLTHFQSNNNGPQSLTCNEIYALLEDRQGRIWVGSFDKGLTLIVEDGHSTKFTQTGSAFQNYPIGAYHKIRHMALDGHGNIWIGTTNGLLLLNANDQHSSIYTYKTYSKIPGDKKSLGINDIQFVYRDSKNKMWLATSGGGFCQAIGDQPFQSLQFRNYTTKDGMPNDYVLSCAEDKMGNIWIATENGLSKFNPENKVFRNYDAYDGLPKASFSEAAVSQRLAEGQLIFGTTKGYLSFDADHINASKIAANIAFTNLQINNNDAGPGMDETVLQNGINYVTELTLKYNQDIISIDYAILDYRAGSKHAFAYRLVGFDDTWHDDRQLRRATYTNLPPGHYVFEVKTLSSDLYSNTPFKQLAITILPPPWKTWWAYLLYAILISILLYFIRQYTLAMIHLRNKIAIEQKLAALKLNFFTNVSHELRTPLTLIVNPLEQLSKKENLSPEGASYVDVARKNAARMVRFINQLLDLRKVQSDKATLHISRVEMIMYVKKICDHFTEAARSKRIKLEISSDQKELITWVDAEKMDVVIYNLIGNALKFTPEGKIIEVNIISIPEEHSFSIAIYDQGPGVDKKKLEEIFELFHQGDQPTERDKKGTGIGLALSKEFVNLHGGKIWAVNNEDGGLTVTVKLKKGAEHYKKDEVSFVDMPKISIAQERPIEHVLLPQPLYASSPKNHQAPLVLLVEDNDELRTFLKGQLSEFYRVETAKDGQEGFVKAIDFIPELIVSDIMMPVMDGIQLLDKLKNDINTSHIPVVLLSAKYSIESQIEGLKYGADYYI